MFISNLEKENIHTGMLNLHSEVAKLKTEILFLTGKIKALEVAKPAVKRVKKKMTAEQKAKQRQYQKAYNERKKSLAIAAKLLTEETNVSS
jgi:Tfp pilus assembly protein PilN